MKTIFLVTLLFCGWSFCVEAAVSAEALIEEAGYFDGTLIEYEGELIGEVLKRGDHVWMNILNGQSAIGVWGPGALAEPIEFAGGYKVEGDHLLIEGVFSRSCDQHGGSFDIHANRLEVIAKGGTRVEVIDARKNIALKALLGVFLCLWIVHILRKRLLKR